MRRVAQLLAAVAVGIVTTLPAQEAKTPGPIIDSIVVVTANVFAPEEARGNLLFRMANAVHVTTRPYVVWEELLFAVGQPYDSAEVEESMRNLRSRGLFRDVTVDTTHVGDRVRVTVRAFDGWTTELQGTISQTAGTFTWAAGILERNLLGTGARAGVSYRKEPDRTAVSVLGGMDRVRGTRLAADLLIDNLSDGIRRDWLFGLPFRAFDDRVGFGLLGGANDERILRFRDGSLVDTFRRRLFLQRAQMAYAPIASSSQYLRVGIAGQVKREEYRLAADSLLAIPDTVTGAVGVFANFVTARFKVVTHYNGFQRDVDVDLSTRLSLSAWLAPGPWGYGRTGIGPRLFVQVGAPFGDNWVVVQAGANALFSRSLSEPDSGRVWAGITAVSKPTRKQALVLHVEGGAQKGVAPGREFDLGNGIGPRVFEAHAFTGTRAIWGSLEHRAFVIDEIGSLLALGFAAFVDYGGAWFPDQGARFGGDVGAGIRFGATRSTGPNIGRLDLAYRFGDGVADDRWVVTFGRGFMF